MPTPDIIEIQTGGLQGPAGTTSPISTDGTLSLNRDTYAPAESAVKTYVDGKFDAINAGQYKGVLDCSGNPNYPAASAGHYYFVTVAGKIGGGSGQNVEAGDRLDCIVDSSAAGTHAAVGANWKIGQGNIDGAVVGPTSAVSGNVPSFNGTSGKIVQDSGKAVADLVTGPVSATNGRIATFNGATGKVIQDGGKSLPSGIVVGDTDTQTISGKSLVDASTYIVDDGDNTKRLQFQIAGFTAGQTRILTPPNYNGTIATLDGAETFTNKAHTGGAFAGGALSGTFSGARTRTGLDTVSLGAATSFLPYWIAQPTDYGPGNPRFSINKTATAAKYDLNLFDTVGNVGNINMNVGTFTWNDSPVMTRGAAETLTGTKTFAVGTTIFANPAGDTIIEMGRTDNVASNNVIDFHTGTDGTNDFDSRILASGGNASDGQGTISITSAVLQHNGVALSRVDGPVFTLPPRLPSYTVATLPSAATYVRGLIYVSDGTSNKRQAASDGANWRWPDGAIVS